jgi:hypothetical protein
MVHPAPACRDGRRQDGFPLTGKPGSSQVELASSKQSIPFWRIYDAERLGR